MELRKFIATTIREYLNENNAFNETYRGFINESDSNSGEVELILYHGSPFSFNKFKEQDDGITMMQGQSMVGVSFTENKKNANPYAKAFPNIYYDKKDKIKKKYSNIEEILKKVKDKKYQEKIRKPKVIKKDAQIWIDSINKEWKEDKEWLYNNNFEKFKKRKKNAFNIISDLEKEYKHSTYIHNKKTDLTKEAEKLLYNYNKEIDELDKYIDSEYGYLYTVKIVCDGIVEVDGEDVGIGAGRDQEITQASIENKVLKINNAEAGYYIGTEYITSNLDKIKIIKKEKV